MQAGFWIVSVLLLTACAASKIETRVTDSELPASHAVMNFEFLDVPLVKRDTDPAQADPSSPSQPVQIKEENFQQPDPRQNIFFAQGSVVLSPEAGEIMSRFAKTLKENRRARLLLIVYTNDPGSREYCLALSKRRVAMVATELIKRGARPIQIREMPQCEESSGLTSCLSERCRQARRRLEFRLLE